MQRYIAEIKDKARPEQWQSVIAHKRIGNPTLDFLVIAPGDKEK